MKTLQTSTKGFTLIELMVVVAIIGILNTIALPHFTGVLSKAKERARIANKEIIKSVLYNAYSNAGVWPSAGGATANLAALGPGYDPFACIAPVGTSCVGGFYTAPASFVATWIDYLPKPPSMHTASGSNNWAIYSDQYNGGSKTIAWPMEPGSPASDCPGAGVVAGSFIDSGDPNFEGYDECVEVFAS